MTRISTISKEIEQVMSYARGLGILVKETHVKKLIDNAATWSTNPPEIEVYVTKSVTKTDILLSLLHELGHHHDWLATGRPDVPGAYQSEADRKPGDGPISKDQRRIIYDSEFRGISYMFKIAKQLGLRSLPEWRIKEEMAFDKWTYRYYYYHGEFPDGDLQKKKRTELRVKYKENKNEQQ